MAHRRFYCEDLSGDPVTLGSDEAAHARKSLRLAEGDVITLFDGRGTTATGQITELTRRMVVQITDRSHVKPLRPTLDLAIAIPKGDRAAVLIESAAQLGVDRVIPLTTDRSVVEPGKNKQQRFERIATEAAKQCGRTWMMAIAPPIALGELLMKSDHDLRFICDVPSDTVQALQSGDDLRSKLNDCEKALALVGPEGGWTDAERAAAAEAGCLNLTLNANVLRVETAGLAAAAILRS